MFNNRKLINRKLINFNKINTIEIINLKKKLYLLIN